MQHSHSAPVFYPISKEGFQVWLGNRKLSSHQSSTFFDHIHGKTILNWNVSHHRFPACYARRIDWDVCAATLKRLPLGRPFAQWAPSSFDGKNSRPWTALAVVSTRTLAMCGPAKNLPALLMPGFSKWLESIHTAKDVTYWIIQRLTEWRSSEPFSRPHSDMPGLLQAIAAQDRIG